MVKIPQTVELKKTSNIDNIEFVFISIEENARNWKKAAKKLNLVENNFLLQNRFYTSTLVKELKLDFLPRYIIIDKKGNVVNHNAPKPTEEIISNFRNNRKN